MLKIIIDHAEKFSCEDYILFYNSIKKSLNKKALDFLVFKNIELVWNKIQPNSKNSKQFMLFFHQWFDALMIIQLLKKLNN